MTAARYAAWAARIFARPLLAEPWAAACVLGVLADRLGIETVTVLDPAFGEEEMEVSFLAGEARQVQREPREYAVTEDGLAVVPVMGSLVARSGALRPQSGMTGYSAVERAVEQAMGDRDVRGVLMEIDSPGGEASGALEASRYLATLRGTKPMWAVAAPQAASSAYALASAADRIIMPRSGDVGSVGVLGIHVDASGELAGKGRRVTLFQKGARKTDRSPFGPLSEEAAARINERLDGVYDEFVRLVATNRKLTLTAVRETEADTFDGPEAVRLGLADAVMDPREAVAEFRSHINRGATRRPAKEQGMTAPATGASGDGALNVKTYTQQELDQALLAARKASLAEGYERQRERFAGILGCEEAAGRSELAHGLALDTDLSVEAAKKVLARTPVAAPPEPAKQEVVTQATDFEQHMARVANPKVGANGGGDGDEADEIGAFLMRARLREGRA